MSVYQAGQDADEVDLQLIEALLMYVFGEGRFRREGEDGAVHGAVLVFLPGVLSPLFLSLSLSLSLWD